MEVILIRHGKPDYAPVTERGFIGHGRALAPLTSEGEEQARRAADDPALQDAELIVASPLTRALETAGIIAGKTGLPLTVEVDLREWEPDRTYQFASDEESAALHQDFWACKGEWPEGETRKWEPITEVIQRVDPVMKKYYEAGYQKIIVVAHGGIIRRFTGDAYVTYCKPYCVEYNGDFNYFGWVE